LVKDCLYELVLGGVRVCEFVEGICNAPPGRRPERRDYCYPSWISEGID
jgi:hypothetical protein